MFGDAAELRSFNDNMTARYTLGVKHLGGLDGQIIPGQRYISIPGGYVIGINENVQNGARNVASFSMTKQNYLSRHFR